MRKYRYGDPTQVSFFKKYSHFAYFFVAWNLLGFTVWKAMNANKEVQQSSWKEKSGTEKYLSLIGYGENKKVTHVKIQGLQVDETSESKQAE